MTKLEELARNLIAQSVGSCLRRTGETEMINTEKNIPDWIEDLPAGQSQPWLVREQCEFISIRQRDGGDPDTFHWVLIPKEEAATFLAQFSEACAKETSAPTTAGEFLNKAYAIMESRSKEYDRPEGERSMGRTIEAFNAVAGRNLTEAEGWLLLQLLKDVRQWQRPEFHRDSAEDCVAYAALKAEALVRGL